MMNSGIDDEVTPSSTIARSAFRSRRRAAYSPAAMLDRDRDDQGQAGELGRAPDRREDLGQHRLPGHERVTEVEGDEALDDST